MADITIEAGDKLVVESLIENIGSIIDTQRVELIKNSSQDLEVEEDVITLYPSESEKSVMDWQTVNSDTGSWTVKVYTRKNSDQISVEITEPKTDFNKEHAFASKPNFTHDTSYGSNEIVAENIIIFVDGNNYYDAGTVFKLYEGGEPETGNHIHRSPVVTESNLTTCIDNYIYTKDMRDGDSNAYASLNIDDSASSNVSINVGDMTKLAPPSLNNGSFYLAGEGPDPYVISITPNYTNGNFDLNWSKSLSQSVSEAVTIDTTNSNVYVGQGTVLAVDKDTGGTVWETNTSVVGDCNGLPAVTPDGTTVYAVDQSSGALVAINTTDGTEKWRYTNLSSGTAAQNPTITSGGKIVVSGDGADEDLVHCVNPDGTQKWVNSHVGNTDWQTGDRMLPYATELNGDIFYHSRLGNIWRVSLVDGSTQWHIKHTEAFTTNPAYRRGYLYENINNEGVDNEGTGKEFKMYSVTDGQFDNGSGSYLDGGYTISISYDDSDWSYGSRVGVTGNTSVLKPTDQF